MCGNGRVTSHDNRSAACAGSDGGWRHVLLRTGARRVPLCGNADPHETANTGVRLLRNEGMPYLASCMCVCVCALVCGRIHVRGRVEVLVAGIRRVEPGAGVATTRRHPRRGQKAIDDTLILYSNPTWAP